MKAYKTHIKVTTEWTIEVHAEDGQDAEKTASDLGQSQIEAGGDFERLVSTEVTDVEEMYPDDKEEEILPLEPEQEPGDPVNIDDGTLADPGKLTIEAPQPEPKLTDTPSAEDTTAMKEEGTDGDPA